MTAEVSAVLLGAVSPGQAASLLQQLGLLLDFWGLLQQHQHQQHQQQQQQQQQLQQEEEEQAQGEAGARSEVEEWCCELLDNQQYLRVIR
jgi:flagellar biosynthesis component FlhA